MIKAVKIGRYVLMGLLIWFAIDIATDLGSYSGAITSASFIPKLIQFFYIFAVYMFTTAVDMFTEHLK
jgi:uncharacterized membrane protein